MHLKLDFNRIMLKIDTERYLCNMVNIKIFLFDRMYAIYFKKKV